MPVSTIDENVALVVIDLQNSTVGRPGLTPRSGAEVVANTVRLADAFRAAGKPVVLVRMITLGGVDAPAGRTQIGSRSGGAEPPAGWDQIVPELTGHPEDLVVSKRNWGAFHGTDLDLLLRRRGITQIVLTGVATSIGVDSSARAAYEHGYHVVVAEDAITDLRPDAHALSTGWIFPLLGEVGTVEHILALLK